MCADGVRLTISMRVLRSLCVCALRAPDITLLQYFALCVCDVGITVTDEASDVFQHHHSDPLRNWAVLHGVVMKDVGDDDSLQ